MKALQNNSLKFISAGPAQTMVALQPRVVQWQQISVKALQIILKYLQTLLKPSQSVSKRVNRPVKLPQMLLMVVQMSVS